MKNMNNKWMLVLSIVIIFLAGGFIFLNSYKADSLSGSTGAVIDNVAAQKIILWIKNYNYYPSTLEVEAGKPVELTLDESVSGCLRSFTSKELGISQYSRNPEDKIKFTPEKKGTFTFACSMGMGFGKLIVK